MRRIKATMIEEGKRKESKQSPGDRKSDAKESAQALLVRWTPEIQTQVLVATDCVQWHIDAAWVGTSLQGTKADKHVNPLVAALNPSGTTSTTSLPRGLVIVRTRDGSDIPLDAFQQLAQRLKQTHEKRLATLSRLRDQGVSVWSSSGGLLV